MGMPPTWLKLITFRQKIMSQVCDNLWSDTVSKVREGTWKYIYNNACTQSQVYIEEPLIEEPLWE